MKLKFNMDSFGGIEQPPNGMQYIARHFSGVKLGLNETRQLIQNGYCCQLLDL